MRACVQQVISHGRHVNASLREADFRMNTLEREGSSLFGGARYCGTVDVSAAYYHVHMHPDATTHLGIQWHGQDNRFFVLPFGKKSA